MKHSAVFMLLWMIPLIVFSEEEPAVNWPTPGSVDLSFKATDEMREFLNHPSLNHRYDNANLARNLIKLLFGPDGSGFTYDARLTLSPPEAFKERRGNCITFAMLFITLAREIGLKTEFNEMNTNPSWNQNRDLVVETGHVNVVVFSYPQNFVVEWLDSYRDLSNHFVDTVSDNKIRSDFYSNLGIEAMAQLNYNLSEQYIEYAKSIDPRNPSVWQNFGVLWLRMKQPEKAESAFLTGLKYSGKQTSLYFLIAKFYQRQGKEALASRYLKKGEKYARKNPFYHYQLAMDDFENGNFRECKGHLLKAIDKLPKYHLFHYMLAKCHEANGDKRSWENELLIAINCAQTPEISERYRLHLNQMQTSLND